MQPESHGGHLVAAALAVLLLATAVGPAAGLVADGAQEPPPGESIQTDIETVEADRVDISIVLAADGSANWTVEYWTELDDENTTAAWASFQRDVRQNPSNYTDRFASRIRTTLRSSENATGREMTATDFSVRAENRSLGSATTYGVVAYEFTWSNFSVVENGSDGARRLRAGDAIGGFFLAERTTMVVQWPTAYERVSVTPPPTDTRSNAVIWEGGSTTFVAGEPSLLVERPANDTAGGGGSGVGSGGSVLLLAAIAVVVTAAGAALAYRARHDDELSVPAEAERSRADELRDVPASAQNRPDAVRHVDGVPEDGAIGGGDGDGEANGDEEGTSESTEAGDAEPADLPDELLSNEEQVLKFLRESGGRAKQQEVVTALDWTEAKTSQVVSGMREEGTIDGFRLGRENVLTLPDVDIELGPDDGDESDGDENDT